MTKDFLAKAFRHGVDRSVSSVDRNITNGGEG